jgi:hypothetical protein
MFTFNNCCVTAQRAVELFLFVRLKLSALFVQHCFRQIVPFRQCQVQPACFRFCSNSTPRCARIKNRAQTEKSQSSNCDDLISLEFFPIAIEKRYFEPYISRNLTATRIYCATHLSTKKIGSFPY